MDRTPSKNSPTEELRSLLKSLSIKPKHFLGQHFLVDEGIFENIIAVSGITKNDTVVEIGTGIGNLTFYLTLAAKKVITIEKDRALLEVLPKLLEGKKNVTLLPGDILQIPFADIVKLFNGGSYHIVANLPYNITAKTIEKIVSENPKPKSATLMIQREVADRLIAQPGDMSMIALVTQMRSVVKKCFEVQPSAFFPPPEVTSAVIKINPLTTPAVALPLGLKDEDIFRMAKSTFRHKRKILANGLSSTYRIPVQEVKKILVILGLSENVRPQELSLAQWVSLAEKILL